MNNIVNIKEIYNKKEIISLDDLSDLLYKNADNIDSLVNSLEPFSAIVFDEIEKATTYAIRTKEEWDSFYSFSIADLSLLNKYKPGDYVKLLGDNKSTLVVTDYPIMSEHVRDRLTENIRNNPLESYLFNDDLLIVPCYGIVNGVLAGYNCDGFTANDFHFSKLKHIEDNSFPWLNPVANCIFRATMDFEDNNFDEKFYPTKFVAKLIEHEDEIDFWCYNKKSNNFVRELYEQFIKDIENEE